jgi:hypothetical protein
MDRISTSLKMNRLGRGKIAQRVDNKAMSTKNQGLRKQLIDSLPHHTLRAIVSHANQGPPKNLCLSSPCLQIFLAVWVDIDFGATIQWCPLRLLLEQPHSHNILHQISHGPRNQNYPHLHSSHPS